MRLYIILGAAIVGGGCDRPEPAKAQDGKGFEAPSDRPATKWELGQLDSRVSHIEDMRVRRTLYDNTTALLNANPAGFSIVDTQVGPISLRIMSVEANGTGSHVKLAIGNPTSATLLRPSANLEWGTMNDKGDPNPPVGKQERFNFVGKLEPGHWTEVTVPLANTPPTKVGYLRVQYALVGGMELVETKSD